MAAEKKLEFEFIIYSCTLALPAPDHPVSTNAAPPSPWAPAPESNDY